MDWNFDKFKKKKKNHDAAYQKGNFAAVGFVRWKHLEDSKETNKNFWTFFNL